MVSLRVAILCSLSLELLHLFLAYGDPSGFISIDCGSAEKSYVDKYTNLTFVSDSSFVTAGEIGVVPSTYSLAFPKYLWHLRSFPKGKRNCYALQPVTPGSKYLLRTSFLYGNFDGLNSFPQFDLYLGVTFLQTVNASASVWKSYEFIVKATRSNVTLCLCKTTGGAPFISAIELRPMVEDTVYPVVNDTLALNLWTRVDFGSRSRLTFRFPNDEFDRFWFYPWSSLISIVNTSLDVSSATNPYKLPSVVMQTAEYNPDHDRSMVWQPGIIPRNAYLFMCLHFAELQLLGANETREFIITLDDEPFHGPVKPSYLNATSVCSQGIYRSQSNVVKHIPTINSTFPPISNAIELYTVVQLSTSLTDEGDATVLLNVLNKYRIDKAWTGDPCLPLKYSWEGLICSNDTSPPRVISLDLSNSGLSGEILQSLANLTAIVSLNLAGNKLTGNIPDFLADLPRLRELDLSNNDLNGSVPDALLRKRDNGSLTLSVSGNEKLSVSDVNEIHPKKGNKGVIIGATLSAAAVLILLVASLVIAMKMRKRHPASKQPSPAYKREAVARPASFQAFKYSEVVAITGNFSQKIGEGGYGPVFRGHLPDGRDVAVKILSHKSKQGSKEFYNEVDLLSRIHHRNLVSLLGYCDESENMILIYEYIPRGNLREALSGRQQASLDWKQRLQIALNAAQGLDYLHTGCNPVIIHRDVKSANILLNYNFEAKIADFGLSKSDMVDGATHVSTAVLGTPGYLDPEYSFTNWLSEKSDVYSFGVVLLELICGKQPVVVEPSGERVHIANWVRSNLLKSDHTTIADPKLDGRYHDISLSKVANLALECTENKGIKRPNMSRVVNELKEAIAWCNAEFNVGASDNIIQQHSEASSSVFSNNSLIDDHGRHTIVYDSYGSLSAR